MEHDTPTCNAGQVQRPVTSASVCGLPHPLALPGDQAQVDPQVVACVILVPADLRRYEVGVQFVAPDGVAVHGRGKEKGERAGLFLELFSWVALSFFAKNRAPFLAS
jgi:hypothetical protein